MNLSDRDRLILLKSSTIKNRSKNEPKKALKMKIFCNLESCTIFFEKCENCENKCFRYYDLKKVLENFKTI